MSENRSQTAVILILLVASTSIGVVPMMSEVEIRDPWQITDTSYVVNVTVKNLGLNPAEQIPLRLALPLDDMDDQSLVSWESSESAERESVDSLGNSFLHYTIPHIEPQSNHTVQLRFEMRHWSVDYDIEADMVGDAEPEQDIWLMDSQYIDVSDDDVISVAEDIALDGEWALDIGWNTYEWVIDNIRYQQIAGESDAGTTIRNGEGGSAEFGNTFVALMRANDVPARRLSGWGVGFDQGEEFALHTFAHGWVEFYLPDVGWLPADPTWGIKHRFDNFANSDDNHVTMTRGAGIHFMWRGPFLEPFGETTVNTDYTVYVEDRVEENLSTTRTILIAALFIMPVLLTVFIFIRIHKHKHDVNVNLTRGFERIEGDANEA